MKGCSHPTVITQLYQGIHSVTHDHEPELGPVRNSTEECTINSFEEQTRIGWKHLLMGRIGKNWREANEILTRDYRRPVDKVTWGARLIRAALNNAVDLWMERNKAVHGRTGKGKTSDEENHQIISTIKFFYQHVRPLVLPQDEWLFSQSEKIKTGEKPSNQIAWIDAVERSCRDVLTVLECRSFFYNRRIMTF